MWRELLGIAAGATFMATTAVAETDQSANYYLPACRNFIHKNFTKDPLIQGRCIGLLEGIGLWAQYAPSESVRFCVPDSATLNQITAVVVRWLDQRPERWSENFMALASYALHDAWPCTPNP
jgi:hypothetical protein